MDHHDHHRSSTSIHSMDDDLNLDDGEGKGEGGRKKNTTEEKQSSTIKLHEMGKRIKHDFKNNCCALV